mgnify:CR=1 FL=1
MEKLLKNELFRSFILSIVIFAVLMIGTATSVINSYWQGVLILCGINIILAVSTLKFPLDIYTKQRPESSG